MLVTLQEMRSWLRLSDFETDMDNEIQSNLLAAEEYLKAATGFTFETNVPERAKLIIKYLVTNWYENREPISYKESSDVDYTLKRLLEQLTYTHTEEETS